LLVFHYDYPFCGQPTNICLKCKKPVGYPIGDLIEALRVAALGVFNAPQELHVPLSYKPIVSQSRLNAEAKPDCFYFFLPHVHGWFRVHSRQEDPAR